jgi:hypothetical protein
MSRFKQAAIQQHEHDVTDLLTKYAGSFYVQDNSYFRAAMLLDGDVELKSSEE